MTRTHRIASIPGDGIGTEVLPEGRRVLEAAATRFGFALEWTDLDWGSARFAETGEWIPPGGLERLREHDAIYLGAVGWPGVPDHVSLWGLLIPIRRTFDQCVNLRPCRLFDGVPSPLALRDGQSIDMWIVRENVEGEYSEVGGRLYAGTDHEAVVQETIMTRRGVDRVQRWAFALADSRPARHLTSATKSNGITHTMPFWDERFAANAADFPDVRTDAFHIDILTANFVRWPERYDVVVGSNLFGDILSDLGPAVCGSIGIAPSANLNIDGTAPSMFEPVHGSAPDIAGTGVANPIGAVWSAAMLLDHLGEAEAAAAVIAAIEGLLRDGGPRTPDLSGTASTTDVGAALAGVI
ncbi:MAG TPA: tartrate dehydrogenase [Acidimicrobiales bacterium]|nr:tartrate dehydrogenase [Acidimicrobiales bacterium]